MTIHHATLAKATKLGLTLTQADDTGIVTALWNAKNKRGYSIAGAIPGLVEDMKTWQMIAAEYSHLKVEQPHAKAGNYVWEISLRGDVIGEGERLDDAFEDALDVIGGGKEDGEDEDSDAEDYNDELVAEEDATAEEGEEGDESKSVVKRKYKTAYRPFKAKCGDELSQLVTAHLMVKTEDGVRIDKAKMVRFAKQNGAWDERYKFLNNGLARMSIVNRIRAKVKKGYEIVWN